MFANSCFTYVNIVCAWIFNLKGTQTHCKLMQFKNDYYCYAKHKAI